MPHRIFISLDGALLGLLWAEAQTTQYPPHLGLAKAHAMQPLDDSTHALERPQLGAKAMLGRLLQDGPSHRCKLLRIKLGRPAWLRNGPECIDAALIK